MLNAILNFKLLKWLNADQELSKKVYHEKIIKILLEIIKYCTSPCKDLTFSNTVVSCKFDAAQEEAIEYIKNSKEIDIYKYITSLILIFKDYFEQQGALEEIDEIMKELTFTRPVETKTKDIFAKGRD